MRTAILLTALLLFIATVYGQTVNIGVSADMICRSGCAFGSCGASSKHNQTYSIAAEASGYSGLYFEFPLTSIPAKKRVARALLRFANILDIEAIDAASFDVVSLAQGSFVNESSQSGSTADQNGRAYVCPGAIGTTYVGNLTFNSRRELEAPVDVTSVVEKVYQSGISKIVLSLTPLWDPFTGGFIIIESRSKNPNTATLQVTYDDSTTDAPTIPPTTTTTTSSTTAPLTTTTAAPTSAGTTTTTTTSAPIDSPTTSAPPVPPSTAPPVIETTTTTTTDGPKTEVPQGERANTASSRQTALSFVVFIIALVILI